MSATPSSGPPEDEMEPRRELAAQLLAAGKTQTQVATALDVCAKSIQRWWADPKFKARVRAIRQEIAAVYAGKLTASASDAVDGLVELSKSGTKEDAVRLRGCCKIIELVISQVQLNDLAAELAEVRERLGIEDGSQGHADAEPGEHSSGNGPVEGPSGSPADDHAGAGDPGPVAGGSDPPDGGGGPVA